MGDGVLPKPRRLGQADYEALAAFRFLVRQFLSFSEAAAARAGLTARQYQALLAIQGTPRGAPAPSVGDLARQLLVQHHSAVGLVDRLVQRSLVRRIRDPRDRRQVRLLLTAHGRRALEHLAGAHRRELRQSAGRLKALLETLGT
jgi:DNA-binding MarR family transcriptional regulator